MRVHCVVNRTASDGRQFAWHLHMVWDCVCAIYLFYGLEHAMDMNELRYLDQKL